MDLMADENPGEKDRNKNQRLIRLQFSKLEGQCGKGTACTAPENIQETRRKE